MPADRIVENAYMLALAGKAEDARKILDDPETPRAPRDLLMRAKARMVLGDREAALGNIETLAKYGFRLPPAVPDDPDLAPLKDDPRYKKLRR